MSSESSGDDDGMQASAVLLLALGEDCAADVLRLLTPKEVKKLGERMANLTTVSESQFDDVLSRFGQTVQSQRSLVNDAGAYVSNVLKRALGNDKAGMLINRIVQERSTEGIENLKWMEPAAVAELIRAEHPQIAASILAHLDRDQAAAVLATFEETARNDVMLRIATLDAIQPEALAELNEVLSKVLAGADRTSKPPAGGAKVAAEILNYLGNTVEASVLGSIRESHADLATKIEEQMFTFSDMLKLDNKGMQQVLREVSSESLVVALKGADAELREKVFSNMSSRAAETLREDLSSKGPVRLSEVETQQREILKLVRRLADEGQIVIAGGGGESYV